MITVDGILAQLDDAAREFSFADPEHPYYSAIDARLHAFGDDDRWALLIELVGYNPRAGNVIDVVHTYGNCLTRGQPGLENEDFLSRVDNMDEIEDRDKPSETETFQQLAAVLASRDPTTYRPSMPPNTQWSFWPESGSL